MRLKVRAPAYAWLGALAESREPAHDRRMHRVGWAFAFTCLLALVGLSGIVATVMSTAYADEGPGPGEPPRTRVIRVQTDPAPSRARSESQGFDPANATAPSEPTPARDEPADVTKPGCNAIPFVLPLIGILGLLWLRMKKTMK